MDEDSQPATKRRENLMKGRKLEFNKKHSNRFLMSTGSPFSRLYLKYRQCSTEVPVLTLEEMSDPHWNL